MSLEVLFEDNHLLVVSKPAGLLTQGDVTGDETLLDRAKAYRKYHEKKPGNVYVGLVHRLDRPVSGIVVLAKTSKAASRLAEQFRSGTTDKRYHAVVEIDPTRFPIHSQGIWENRLIKDDQANRVTVLRRGSGGQVARTRWQVLDIRRGRGLLELSPLTGRSHQLRVHCAHHGMPIFGDKKYGSQATFNEAIALHASFLALDHPTTRIRLEFRAPPPPSWDHFPFVLR